jgi:3-oxoacyl-[acyl-carrier protein] reductase
MKFYWENKMKLENKVAIITGGGRSIGRAISLELAREGADIVIADLDLEPANEVVEEIRALGRKAIAVKTDVTRYEDAERMAKAALDEFGQIDVMVNNAGQSARERRSAFCDSTPDVWDFVIGINLKGIMNCSRAVINPMIARKSGKIISMASVAGVVGEKGMVDYSAAKAGVIGFTMSLAKEVIDQGINVNCVSPGSIATRNVDFISKEVYDVAAQATGFGRWGKPEEVAAVVRFLASDDASYVTGQTYHVCGILNL